MSQSGTGRPARCARGAVLGEAHVEERVAVDHLGERLDDAAHARRHSAGHRAERKLAGSERSGAASAESLVLGRALRRELATSPGPGAFTSPFTVLRKRRRASGSPSGVWRERNEALTVETGSGEALAQLRVDQRELLVEVGMGLGMASFL